MKKRIRNSGYHGYHFRGIVPPLLSRLVSSPPIIETGAPRTQAEIDAVLIRSGGLSLIDRIRWILNIF